VSLDRVIGANVKHLVSRSAYLQDKKTHVSLSDPPMSPVYLDSLVIDRPPALVGMFDDSTHRIQMSRLRKLVIDASLAVSLDPDHRATWAILRTCGVTLEEFEFKPSYKQVGGFNMYPACSS